MFVLVADSQSVFQQILAQILEEQGVEYALCKTGADVIKQMAANDVDLFVLAMNLPDTNAANLCRHIRESINDECVPIIILTAVTGGQSFADAFDAGATDIFRRNNIQYFSDYLTHLSQSAQPLHARAMVVEDSQSQRQALEASLKSWGLDVDTFSSVKPAFEAHIKNPYDIILTDIELSGLENGLDFVHDIREQALGVGDVPIIAVTAYLSESTRVNFLARGIDRCMLKPLLMPELRSEIKKQIDAKQARYALEQARKREADKNQAKSDFLARMSHELRTSLNAIIGFSDLLMLGDQHGEETQEYAVNINEAGKLLLGLINEVLDLSRIESGNIELNIEAVSVDYLLQQCQQMMHGFADNHQVKLSFKHEFSGVQVLCDQTRLLEVLLNLISNAVKYNRPGGTVSVSTELIKNDQIRISVIDDGIGISPDYAGQIFEPFSRANDSTGEIQGTGIGLPIALHLVELLGGDLGFSSEEGKGSNFWIDIPKVTITRLNKTETSSLAAPVVLKPCKVIYVDDNPVNRLLIEKWFSKQVGIKAFVLESAKEGLSLLEAKTPDVLITDIHMPEENGYWLLDRIREQSRFDQLPVIALSAMAMNEEVEKGEHSAFDAYITKPIDFTVLTRTLNDLIK